MDTFGSRIRFKREELGITMAELARRVDSNSATIGQIELGKHDNPNIKLVIKFSEVFKCSIDWLLTGEGKSDREFISEANNLFKNYNKIDKLSQKFIREFINFHLKEIGENIESSADKESVFEEISAEMIINKSIVYRMSEILGITQVEFAKFLGISKQAFNQWKHNENYLEQIYIERLKSLLVDGYNFREKVSYVAKNLEQTLNNILEG